MRHRWLSGPGYQFCKVCGARRRRVLGGHGVNPVRHRYLITQVSLDNGQTWSWLRQRQPLPPCRGALL